MTTDVQRAVAFRRPDLPPKGISSYGHDHPLTPQEFQLRASLRRIQDSRWRLRKAEPNSPEALTYARRLAKAYQRWKALYDNWVPGPSGYKPMPIRILGRRPKPQHWEPPEITGHFSDPLSPG